MSIRIDIAHASNVAVGFARPGYKFDEEDYVPNGLIGLIIQTDVSEKHVILGTISELNAIRLEIEYALQEAHAKTRNGVTRWSGASYEFHADEQVTA